MPFLNIKRSCEAKKRHENNENKKESGSQSTATWPALSYIAVDDVMQYSLYIEKSLFVRVVLSDLSRMTGYFRAIFFHLLRITLIAPFPHNYTFPDFKKNGLSLIGPEMNSNVGICEKNRSS